jgi:hypothetical protein
MASVRADNGGSVPLPGRAYVGLRGGEEEAPIGRFYLDALLPL